MVSTRTGPKTGAKGKSHVASDDEPFEFFG